MNLFGDFLQGPTVSVYADKKRLRILARAVVDEEAVSGPYVQRDSCVRSNEFFKGSPVNLSEGFTAD
jgi:hypothetical protein